MKFVFCAPLFLLTNQLNAYTVDDGFQDNFNQLAGKNDFSDVPDLIGELQRYIYDFDNNNWGVIANKYFGTPFTTYSSSHA